MADRCQILDIVLNSDVEDFPTSRLVPQLDNGSLHVSDELTIVFGKGQECRVDVDFCHQTLDLATERVVRNLDALRIETTVLLKHCFALTMESLV